MSNLILSDSEPFELEINYWKKKLSGVSPLLLSTDYARPAFQSANKASVDFAVSDDLRAQLYQLSKTQEVTVFSSLLAIFKVLLYRYSNQEDICVGSTADCNVEGEPGNSFVNTIALRSGINGNQRFVDLLQQVNSTASEAYQYQNVPFKTILNYLVKDGDVSNNPLFRVMFILHDQTALDKTIFNTSDLTFILKENADGMLGSIEYSTDLYRPDTVNRLAGHFNRLLASVISDPYNCVGALPMLTDEEITKLKDFNNTLVYYPAEKTIVDLFEEQVPKAPDNIALRQHEQTMTYSELNERANQLAHYLVQNGVKPQDNIGLIVTRSFNMMIGLYAIMKAGGAYVPIDPDYPLDRQEYILKNSSVVKIIADGDYELEQFVAPDQFLKLNELDVNSYSKENPGLRLDSTQLAYTIYTSGSTGRPKGVMIEHHSAVNLILWVNKTYNIGADDRLLFITSMCFDLSVYDIFGMLAAGGSIVIVEQQELMDVPKLKDMLLNYGITFWDSVPTTMDYLVRELETADKEYLQHTLKVVFMSGDWIPVNLPDRIKKYFPETQVISLGGATEGTVWSNFYPVKEIGKDWSSIPYGRPMDNNFFYILNEQLQPVPNGVPGELYIGGVGVARGYANDKQKTDYSFVKDPFSNEAGGRMYRTGDLGRMLPDYNMEFIGRKDDQVKIRGYRIELGEIESVLRQNEYIRQAVVLARADKDGKKRLVSYVVGKGAYDREKVIGFLKTKLPDYMVPTLWLELDSLPLTSNGKIDKKALPDFDAEEQLKEKYIAPATEAEKILAGIWQDVLKMKNIGIDDNFFDIGGHSLLAVQIMTRIENKIGAKLQIAILFQYPTVRLLNAFIQKDVVTKTDWKYLVPIKATGNKPPLYIIPGAGLNVMNFSSLAINLDGGQPVYGLQGVGLDGSDVQIDSISDIAKFYVNEIIEHNPAGPYIIAGYSIGGFIAVEIVQQLTLMNKDVKMLVIFDTDSDRTRETERWTRITPKIIKRYLPQFLGGTKPFSSQLGVVFNRIWSSFAKKVGFAKKQESAEYYIMLDKIINRYFNALANYKLKTFNSPVYLLKAEVYDHYNDDQAYMGWKKYALKGVVSKLVPGNHISMLQPPNANQFAKTLQSILDND